LCQRFSDLFSQLHKVEAERKAAESRNEQLERRLADLRRREGEQVIVGRSEMDGRTNEAMELRREVGAAEQRAALGSDEADTLAAAAETYKHQAERLWERCREERSQEQAALASQRHHNEELHELRQQHAELNMDLEHAVADRDRVTEELRLVSEGTQHTFKDIGSIEHQLEKDRRNCASSEQEVQQQREDLMEVERKIATARQELENMMRQLEAERAASLDLETKYTQCTEERARQEHELHSLTVALDAQRREGSENQAKLAEWTLEVRRLRERLDIERKVQLDEQQSSEASRAKLQKVRSDLGPAEEALAHAESELARLQRNAADLEDRCVAQRGFREELRQRQRASEAALERLREEYRILTADRSRLQAEVDEVVRDRTRLEAELDVTTPALKDARHRCLVLEDRLASRVRELAEETEKVRKSRKEAVAAKGRVQAMERHVEGLNSKLQGMRASADREHLDRERRTVPVSYPSVPASLASPFGHTPRPHAPEQCEDMTYNYEGRLSPRHSPSPNPYPPTLGGPGVSRSRSALSPCRNVSTPSASGSGRASALWDRALTPGRSPSMGQRSSLGRSCSEFPVRFEEPPHARKEELRSAQDGGSHDAVRFLCEFVAREEERLGLNPALPSQGIHSRTSSPRSVHSLSRNRYSVHTPQRGSR